MVTTELPRFRRPITLDAGQTFAREKDIVGMYVDCAKTYSALSGGGLALCTAISEKLLQRPTWLNPDTWLLAASVLFAASLLLSAAYQYMAVARLEVLSGLRIYRRVHLPESAVSYAFVAYGAMLALFLAGVVCVATVVLLRSQ